MWLRRSRDTHIWRRYLFNTSFGNSLSAFIGVRLCEERIPGFFLTNTRSRAMPAEQTGLGGQGQDLIADALEQNVQIAAGQIRSTNAVVEDQVAAENCREIFYIKDHITSQWRSDGKMLAHFARLSSSVGHD